MVQFLSIIFFFLFLQFLLGFSKVPFFLCHPVLAAAAAAVVVAAAAAFLIVSSTFYKELCPPMSACFDYTRL